MKLDITSRESYLLFITEWKVAYKALSAASRQYKRAAAEQHTCNQKLASFEWQRRYGKAPTKEETKAVADRQHAAQIDCGTSYEIMQKTQKLLPNLGNLADHCRPNTLVEYPRYSGFKEVANYMLALRKEGKRQAQAAWKREHAYTPAAVAA